MPERVVIVAYGASIVVSVLLAGAAHRWPNLGRALYALLFAWAGQLNIRTAASSAETYLGFAQHATIEAYRSFVLGFFARHAVAIVVAIGVAQLAIALLLLMPRNFARVGAAGAIVFLVAIAPLGVGSAFPSSLVLALGAWFIAARRDVPSLPAAALTSWRTWRQSHA